MLLSEAILKGCELYPNQAHGQYFDEEGSACVLGAAAIMIEDKPFNFFDFVTLYLSQTFPQLEQIEYSSPNIRADLWRVITKLNDECRWTREQIAAWLAERGE